MFLASQSWADQPNIATEPIELEGSSRHKKKRLTEIGENWMLVISMASFHGKVNFQISHFTIICKWWIKSMNSSPPGMDFLVLTVERMAIPQSSSWEPHVESFGTQEVDLAICSCFPSPTSILVNVPLFFASWHHLFLLVYHVFIGWNTMFCPCFAAYGSIESQEAATLRIMKHPWSSSTSNTGRIDGSTSSAPSSLDKRKKLTGKPWCEPWCFRQRRRAFGMFWNVLPILAPFLAHP